MHCMVHMYVCTCMSHLDCSVGQVGQQVWPNSTLDPTLILACEFVYSYQDSFIHKIIAYYIVAKDSQIIARGVLN